MAMKRFKLKQGCGAHSENLGDHSAKTKDFVHGNIVESEQELDKMFANKFERLPDHKKKGKAAPVEDEEEEQEEVEEEELTAPLGDDVTSQFPLAQEQDLRVYKKGNRYSVAEPDAPGKAVNEEPLKKSDVSKFIKGYVSKEEDDSDQE